MLTYCGSRGPVVHLGGVRPDTLGQSTRQPTVVVADSGKVAILNEPIVGSGSEVERGQRELRAVGSRIDAWVAQVVA